MSSKTMKKTLEVDTLRLHRHLRMTARGNTANCLLIVTMIFLQSCTAVGDKKPDAEHDILSSTNAERNNFPATHGDVNIDDALKAALLNKYSPDEIYGGNMPAGMQLVVVNYKGKLTGTGITYDLPNMGIPVKPKVGAQSNYRNCSSVEQSYTLELKSEVGEVSNWSAGGSISATLSQSIEVSAEFKSPFGGGGAKSTSSWSVTGTADFSRGGSETKTVTVTDEWPIIAPPNRMFKAQLILSEQDLQDVKWAATFLASGPTEVIFRPTQISGDVCLKTHNNRNYVTTERSDKRKVVANRTWCRIWEHFRLGGDG